MAKKAKVKATETETSTGLVPVIKKGALSLDVGPAVIAGFASAMKAEQEASEVLKQVGAKRYDLLSKLTLGILKAANADHSIDLATAFDKDAKKQGHLNDQLGLALGFKMVQTINAGQATEKKTVAWAREVSEFIMVAPNEKNTDIGRQKATLRTNFIHSLKKCCQAAQGMIDHKIKATMDKNAGTLQLTGPAVKTIFGQPKVLLNEKQTIGTGDTQVKLTQKPSFTAMAAAAGEKRGAVVNRTSNTRGRSQQLANPTAALNDITKAYLSIVNKLAAGTLTDGQKETMQKVHDRLDEILN